MPCLTRVQNALTRRESRAKATIARMPSAVSTNSVNCGFEAKYERSKASSLEKSGGLGNTPWVKAKMRMQTPITRSNTASTRKLDATAG